MFLLACASWVRVSGEAVRATRATGARLVKLDLLEGRAALTLLMGCLLDAGHGAQAPQQAGGWPRLELCQMRGFRAGRPVPFASFLAGNDAFVPKRGSLLTRWASGKTLKLRPAFFVPLLGWRPPFSPID